MTYVLCSHCQLGVFVLLAGCYSISENRALSLGRQILLGLLLGAGYGLALQFLYGSGDAAVKETLTWTNIVASGYISLLKMVIMPLVLVMMIAAVVRMREVADLDASAAAWWASSWAPLPWPRSSASS